MTNFDLVQAVFSVLKKAGVENILVCAGARNAPLVMALKNNHEFKTYNYFEERSAAFFAMGLIKTSGKPVAIITTSGTAVAELLPAVIESYYQGLPLIVVTADRPKNYRGRGSPQSIEQVGLFSNYVESVYDLDVNTSKFEFKWSLKKPLQLNVSFDEPLIDSAGPVEIKTQLEILVLSEPVTQKNSQNSFVNPFIILGEIPQSQIERVVDFITKTKAPVYAESLSQLKNYPQIAKQVIRSSDTLVLQIFRLKLCDSVIRIGGVPTLRFWRDLENTFKHIPVTNFTDLPFSGLARQSETYNINRLTPIFEFQIEKFNSIIKLDEKLEIKKIELFKKFPLSEQSFTNKIAEIVNANSIYLGNSLPIRNWDQFAICKSDHVYANRGANGIDGQVSTYLGWSENKKKSYCYIGDLTALYDLAALGLSPQLNKNQRNIIVINNFGGQIFSRVFKSDNFINAHTTKFYHWAKMWNWNYLLVETESDLNTLLVCDLEKNIIEVLPNNEQTQRFWAEWDLLCQQI